MAMAPAPAMVIAVVTTIATMWTDQTWTMRKGPFFFEETKETRKEIFVKRSELDALMSQDNPDEKKVAKLTGEIYDLHTLMDEKAGKAFGDSPRYGYGRGRGGNGNCRGPRSW